MLPSRVHAGPYRVHTAPPTPSEAPTLPKASLNPVAYSCWPIRPPLHCAGVAPVAYLPSTSLSLRPLPLPSRIASVQTVCCIGKRRQWWRGQREAEGSCVIRDRKHCIWRGPRRGPRGALEALKAHGVASLAAGASCNEAGAHEPMQGGAGARPSFKPRSGARSGPGSGPRATAGPNGLVSRNIFFQTAHAIWPERMNPPPPPSSGARAWRTGR